MKYARRQVVKIGKRYKVTRVGYLAPFAVPIKSKLKTTVSRYPMVRSFSPLASAFWHSGQRYSYSEWLSESTSLCTIRANRRRVTLLQRAQVTNGSEMAVRRVPRTSSCIADTYLSMAFKGHKDHKSHKLLRPKTIFDYGMTARKMQGQQRAASGKNPLRSGVSVCYYVSILFTVTHNGVMLM